MRIVVAYNSPNAEVLEHRGPPARERYHPSTIDGIVAALRHLGHAATPLEADRYLIHRLERFSWGSHDGLESLVLNLAYGVQGRLRYCHVPSLLEMLGVPYVGSGPLGHALATDKAAAKMLFRQVGLTTPDFVIVDRADDLPHELTYPIIAKPMDEATSLGVRLVDTRDALCAVVDETQAVFGQSTLVEQFVAGRELNVSVLGNESPTIFPPLEVILDGDGPRIYTYEHKRRLSARVPELVCPADLPPSLVDRLREIAVTAVRALCCEDWARVDLRLTDDETPWVLEVNSLPSLSSGASYLTAARAAGLTLQNLLERLITVAVERYAARRFQPSLAFGGLGV